MSIRAGSLNRLLRFERRDVTVNEFNEETGSWVEFARAYGQVRAVSAQEFFASLQVRSESTFEISCRYTPMLAGTRASDRIVDGASIYDIRAVMDPDGRRTELRLLVMEHHEAN